MSKPFKLRDTRTGTGTYRGVHGKHTKNPGYEPGNHWVQCPLCGLDVRWEHMKKQWDGKWRCADCWEPRHPQDFVRARRDRIAVPYANSGADVFTTEDTSNHQTGGDYELVPGGNLGLRGSPIPNQSDEDLQAVTALDVGALTVDLLGRTITYSASGLPTGLSISSTTGIISGTLAAGISVDTAYYPTVTASAGTDSFARTFQWDVTALPAPDTVQAENLQIWYDFNDLDYIFTDTGWSTNATAAEDLINSVQNKSPLYTTALFPTRGADEVADMGTATTSREPVVMTPTGIGSGFAQYSYGGNADSPNSIVYLESKPTSTVEQPVKRVSGTNQAFTRIFAVEWPHDDSELRVLFSSQTSSQKEVLIHFNVDTGGSLDQLYQVGSSPTRYHLDGASHTNPGGMPTTGPAWIILAYQYTIASDNSTVVYSIWVNGVLVYDTQSATYGSTWTHNDEWNLGANYQESFSWDEQIGDVLVWDVALSVAEMNTVHAYLNAKWGIGYTTITGGTLD